MGQQRKPHMIGNWKMNQDLKSIEGFFAEVKGNLPTEQVNCWISPQNLHVMKCLSLADSGMEIGAQNCATENSGAFTGENSPEALKDLGASFTLIGHSERRTLFGETSDSLNVKVHKALENKLTVVFCIGETLEEREAGKTFDVLKEQMVEGLANISKEQAANIIVAYEPVWAIGTGKVATAEQAEEAHQFLRKLMANDLGLDAEQSIILYGGSVKPGNVDKLMSCANIDGALVGGASLKPADYQALCQAAKNSIQ
jgi:triosephosphate isomerase